MLTVSWSRIFILVVLPGKLPCLIINLEERFPRQYVFLTILGWWRNCQTYRAHCVCSWPCSLPFAGLVLQMNVGLVWWAVCREKLLREGSPSFLWHSSSHCFNTFLWLCQFYPVYCFCFFEWRRQQMGVKQQAAFFTSASAWLFCSKARNRSILL